jgi:DNA-directed RNA polymerase subunit L
MEIKVLNSEKNFVDLEVNNLTIVEILRVYLNKDSSVEFAAWKREHFTKNPILTVRTKGKDAKKAVKDAVAQITKDLDILEKDFNALK